MDQLVPLCVIHLCLGRKGPQNISSLGIVVAFWSLFGNSTENQRVSLKSLAWILMNITLQPSCLYPGTYSQLSGSGTLGGITEVNAADLSYPTA